MGTVETPLAISESQPVGGSGSPTIGAKAGYKRNACIGSCKHQVWQSIRASSAAPYYLDDYADGIALYSQLLVYCIIWPEHSTCDFFNGVHNSFSCYDLKQTDIAGKMVLL